MMAIALVALVGCKSGTTSASAGGGSAGELKTDDEKALYVMGVMLGSNVTPMKLSPEQVEVITRGLKDAAVGNKPLIDPQQYGNQVQQFVHARAGVAAEGEKKKSEAFLAQAAQAPGAVKTATGLIYQTLKPGTGASPAATDTVQVNYQGSLIDGTVFDSSAQRGTPAEFALNGVIPCWTEGVQKMKVGEKAKIICPSSIAYGDQGRPPKIPGGAALVFEVELLNIKK
jgi:FKBP-type peptidyl-prolyl cis-trans isomerase